MSKNKKWQLSKFPWLPNVLVVSQIVAAVEKSPFFCTSPLWSLEVLGMKVRRVSLSEFCGWVRMTQEVWRVRVGWEERVITGWEQSRQTAEKWAIFVGGRTSRQGGTVRWVLRFGAEGKWGQARELSARGKFQNSICKFLSTGFQNA